MVTFHLVLKLGTLLAGACHVASASAFPGGAGHGKPADSLVAASWYAGWHADDVPLATVSWSKYTHMTYAFAETAPSVHELSLSDSDATFLQQFVSTAHTHGVKALVSVGGWTGGLYYSTDVGSAENRTAFVKTITQLATKYNLDGIDFDWEYPNSAGIGCNQVNADDVAHFLSFLQELRADPIGAKLFLTAATPVLPWSDASGNHATNLTGFGTVLDYVAIMNYDVWGPWAATAGPNAPLDDACVADPATQAVGSAVSAVNAWHATGIPYNKIVLGVAGYGHSFRVKPADALPQGANGPLASYPVFDAADQPLGDKWDDPNPGPDVCGNPQGAGGAFDYWGLIEGGFLYADGTPAAGISYSFDACSQTPYVYNATSQVYIAYDDAKSFAAKGAFIEKTGLRGFAMWQTGGDYKDTLMNSIRGAAGFA
ncbi:glycoside hydrolase family 18 protein [Auriscalpium vulgare]|uniref:Glycoside hydrolase family 18 protein n=1 Tax=Auriscalpium vulgare TaxID=40419 RepID=A0ACB8RZE4_9AGAM|nr:glycoside hydrolase family 18 protein [Auriscalpium vulgare]